MGLLGIGQMAELNGVSVMTSHVHQDKGIPEPREVAEG